MNLISEKVGFDYRLYFSPDGKYGTEGKDGHINGMIGEVFKNVSPLNLFILKENLLT